MKFLSVSDKSIEEAAKVLHAGGLVAFPTETVYGLGADAFNPEALAKVFEVKNRPRFDPLIIHIAAVDALENAADLSRLSAQKRKKLFTLAENLMPGPLSVVLPKNEKIPGIATAGLSTAAVRIPDNDAARKLISLSSGAVAAPSANPFGSLSPTRAEHVRDGLGDKIDIILDGGAAQIGLESTVLDLTGEKIKILRPGGTPKEAIEELIGKTELCPKDSPAAKESDSRPRTSPGRLKSHYAPKTPLTVLTSEEIIHCLIKENCAFLFFDDSAKEAWLNAQGKPPETTVIKVLSQTGNLLEAAANLFETLHELDKRDIKQIYAQLAPSNGLGEAINDRLTRASTEK